MMYSIVKYEQFYVFILYVYARALNNSSNTRQNKGEFWNLILKIGPTHFRNFIPTHVNYYNEFSGKNPHLKQNEKDTIVVIETSTWSKNLIKLSKLYITIPMRQLIGDQEVSPTGEIALCYQLFVALRVTHTDLYFSKSCLHFRSFTF